MAFIVDCFLTKIFGKREEHHHHHHHTQEKLVEKIVEKVVNVSKDTFENDQKMLETILNNGYTAIKNKELRSGMSIGPSGTGKSTVLNVFYGGNFTASVSATDVTKEMSSVYSSESNMDLIDTVGFLPTLANVGKMFVLFFHRGLFPDHLIYPANNDRIVDIISLRELIEMGLIKVTIIPFNSKVYYTLKEYNIPNPREKSLQTDVIPHIRNYINVCNWAGNVEVHEQGPPPSPTGSMREVFLRTFFKDGKYQHVSYENHVKQLKERDSTALLRGLLVEAIAHLGNHADVVGGRITRINECNYLKG